MTEWQRIEDNLPHALDTLFLEFISYWNSFIEDDEKWQGFVRHARDRYENGRAQHAESDSTWDKWTDEDFAKNIREELLDAVIYEAERNVRRV